MEPYTIHDSFICSEDEVPVVKSILLSTFNDMYEITPSLHDNNILEEGVEDNIDEEYDYGDVELFFNY